MSSAADRRAADLLLHPLVIAAIALWALNDHVLKPWFGNWITGKLSDVACLFVCPLLPAAALDCCGQRLSLRAERILLLLGASSSGAIMVAINLFEPAADVYREAFAYAQWPLRATLSLVRAGDVPPVLAVQLTMDQSDLLTLPVLLFSLRFGSRRGAPPRAAPLAPRARPGTRSEPVEIA